MIDFSEFVRSNGNLSNIEIWKSLRAHNVYIAENVGDYLKNKDKIEMKWYQGFLPPLDFFTDKIGYVFINNVGVRVSAFDVESARPSWFHVHDETGEELMNWHNDPSLIVAPPIRTFNEVQEQEGLKLDDFVSRVIIHYCIDIDLPCIIDVEKQKYKLRSDTKESLLEKVRSYSLIPSLLPQPA